MTLDGAELGYRVVGAVGGSFIALVIVEPGTWLGAAKRGSVSFICGMFFADVIADYLDWSMIVPNRIIVASALSAMTGWWICDGIIRLARLRVTDWLASRGRSCSPRE